MQALGNQPVRTFTIGFDNDAFDEAAHARAVARHLGTNHTELHVPGQAALDVIPRLPTMFDEPFGDSSAIPTFLVAQLARRHVTVALSGDGGDELFGGYNRHFHGERIWRGLTAVPLAFRRAAAHGLRALPSGWDALAAPVVALVPRRKRVPHVGERMHRLAGVVTASSGVDFYRRLASHDDRPEALVIGGREPPTVLTTKQPWRGSTTWSR